MPETKPRERKSPRFALGDRVRISGIVQKVRDEHRTVSWEAADVPQRESYRMDAERRWERHLRPLDEGVVIGQRSLAEYTVYSETDYGEYGVSYGTYTVSQQVPGTAKRAWLVAVDLHRKPVLVLDEQIAPAEEQHDDD